MGFGSNGRGSRGFRSNGRGFRGRSRGNRGGFKGGGNFRRRSSQSGSPEKIPDGHNRRHPVMSEVFYRLINYFHRSLALFSLNLLGHCLVWWI